MVDLDLSILLGLGDWLVVSGNRDGWRIGQKVQAKMCTQYYREIF
ncbi:unnamed protein product [Acidithrix sp. C25]|nr:unnamed protein product [Acidithrix sp. C25]